MLMLLLTVAVVHFIALLSPGPDFFFVSQTAVSRSRREAMMGVLGITVGVMVWAGVALLGLHLILEKMAEKAGCTPLFFTSYVNQKNLSADWFEATKNLPEDER